MDLMIGLCCGSFPTSVNDEFQVSKLRYAVMENGRALKSSLKADIFLLIIVLLIIE